MDHIEQDGLKSEFSFPNLFKNKFNLFVVILVFAGLFLLAVGAGLWLFQNKGSGEDIKIISASQSAVLGEVVVHVDGAVNKPGVYRLSADLRVNDAIAAAGGFTKGADTSKINLAAKLADGQKIHVASIGESSSSTNQSGGFVNQSDLVSINTATESELDRLPGIGPVTASKIISLRPYSSLNELLGKKAVSKSTFEKIKGLISL